jgi:hypothetical protein
MGLFNFFKNKDNGFDLEKVLRMEDPDSGLMELDTRLNDISNYGENLSRLTEPQKIALFIGNLEREINNGGFNQFYLNSSGDYAHEASEGLRLIGATKTFEILNRANSVWPKQTVPKDRLKRLELQEKLEEQANPIWEKFDTDYYEYPDHIAALLGSVALT